MPYITTGKKICEIQENWRVLSNLGRKQHCTDEYLHSQHSEKKVVKCLIFLMLRWVGLQIQTQPTFSHIAEVAKHSFHQISVVCKFLKEKIWHHISHKNVPNGVLAKNVTNGKK